MKATVNLEDANDILQKEVSFVKESCWVPKSKDKDLIKDVMLGSHLTYRYILLNALLAKTTNLSINPLALQAGSELEGAYDARSLCHKVVIKNKVLNEKLGGSNEPFLNKPARFKELSLGNAVRKGKDQQTLSQVIHILKSINIQDDVNDALRDAIYFIFQRNGTDISEILSQRTDKSETNEIFKFSRSFISHSYEGETCALITGAALYWIGQNNYNNFKVKVHPVNQCGASSKEVSDIDAYASEKLIWSAEVKDKLFIRQDVDHAVRKIITSSHYNLIFILGPNAAIIDDNLENIEDEWGKRGISITFIDIMSLVKMVKIVNPELTLNDFANSLWDFAKMARVKDDVFKHIEVCLKQE